MFKHILLPTDGSALSETAIREGVRLAKDANARITGLSVSPPFHVLAMDTEMIEDTEDQYLAASQARSRTHLAQLEREAAESGVPCRTVVDTSDHPYESIIRTAEADGCDLILMASHGRRGVKALLLGSETHKVLVHSRIPVLVYR